MHAAAFFLALWLPSSPAADTVPRWMAVSVGNDHACALDEHGRAYCWGNNHSAQLGALTREHCGVIGESGRRGCYPLPSDSALAVLGGMRFQSISAGRDRTCALDEEGRAFCWGAHIPGAGKRCLSNAPCTFTPLPYEPGRRFRTLEVGSQVMCGVSTEREALCTALLRGHRWWEAGDLRPPAPGMAAHDVDAISDWPIANVCVVDASGVAWCRGTNRTAQLGTGMSPRDSDPDSTTTLSRVAAGVAFRSLVVQTGWVCGLDADGRAHCWGLRSRGEHPLAQPAPGGCRQYACAPSPVPVAGALRFREIGAHYQRVCGLTAGGEAHCWGPEGEPTRLVPEHRFTSLASNAEFGSGACGITVGGELFCWGKVNTPPGLVTIRHPAR